MAWTMVFLASTTGLIPAHYPGSCDGLFLDHNLSLNWVPLVCVCVYVVLYVSVYVCVCVCVCACLCGVFYVRFAQHALYARRSPCAYALLKERSPRDRGVPLVLS